ncbi:probable metal-nicotianamine transporter YSL7 [Rhodamnia argentea]|uniref:Probable metal-nicotianamine transporter YSL7 n=1 Tax=Rhodamnia argentea TaxID=178133 RepID=A0ABM3HPD4_9MYRT|nr:probable metal-nicotianamine transporter YSL7 [Rhodamnia argentea]
MICHYIVNISVLLGGILSWGLMWPLIGKKAGDWYSAHLKPGDTHGLQGYKVFIYIAMILGDGLYNFCKVFRRTLLGLYHQVRGKNNLPRVVNGSAPESPQLSFDDQRRTSVFLKDQIPTSFAIGGCIVIAIISIISLPHIFHQLKWYHILIMYLAAPALSFCNAYGCGLTDWSPYWSLSYLCLTSHGGVLAGLAACGVMMNIVSTAADLTQDFKTGCLTLASPRSMFVSQVIGTAMGCVVSPCVFWLFYKAFKDLGLPTSVYPAPYADIYRSMALLGVEGFSSLPKHCLILCYGFFAASIVMNVIRDSVPKKYSMFILLPMATAIPFYLGSYFAIDMCVGSLILYSWERSDRAKADAFVSGLICGDGIWALPTSILALTGVKPPICMKFLSRVVNNRVDEFLNPS